MLGSRQGPVLGSRQGPVPGSRQAPTHQDLRGFLLLEHLPVPEEPKMAGAVDPHVPGSQLEL